jgi:hypothetical protein
MSPAVLERADALASELPEPQREAAQEGIVRLLEAVVAHRSQVVHASPDQLTEAIDVAARIIATLVSELPAADEEDADTDEHSKVRLLEEVLTGLDRVDPERVPEVWDYLERLREHLVEETSNDDLEERNRRRLQVVYRSIMDDSYTVKDLRNAWDISRQRLQQLRGENRLFAIEVPHRKGFFYPRWQFDPETKPWSFMPDLIGTAKAEALDPVSFHRLMTNPRAGNGTAPIELAKSGDVKQALGIIRVTGEQGG